MAKIRFKTIQHTNFRVNYLLPMLKPQYVVDRIVDAVLTDQAQLFLPRFLYFVKALSGY